MKCPVCFHKCELKEGQVGLCHARMNQKGKSVPVHPNGYTSIALDPIEKKPLTMFYRGHRILSVGGFGCNLRCPFCQNYEISMADASIPLETVTPQELVQMAGEQKFYKNIGIAFTYNEPLIHYETIVECAKLLHLQHLFCVVVSNGTMDPILFKEVAVHIDAINIDLKGFSQSFYDKVQGDLDCVKENIITAHEHCHLELTTLVIPGLNDSLEEMEEQAKWIASIDPEIPLHLTRFFPRYQMKDAEVTPIETLQALSAVAKRHLRYVFLGNC